MNKKKALTRQKDELGEGKKDESKKYDIIGEDQDTKKWDQMTAQEVCENATKQLKLMFKTGYVAIKTLAYIELKGRWRELEDYKTNSFSYFVEDYFGIRAGTYFNMKALAYKYGPENFDQ